MNTDIAVRDELDVMTLGQLLATSGYFADASKQAQAVIKILAGREIGFGPIASMTGIYIVKGKVTLSANLMAAAVKRSGKYDYSLGEFNDAGCTITFFEKGKEIGKSRFGIEDAKRAGLTNNDTYSKFPRNMFFARAMSNGCKWFCPDIFGGPVYTPDELGTPVDEDGAPVRVVNTTTGEVDEVKAEFQEQQRQEAAREIIQPKTNGHTETAPPEHIAAMKSKAELTAEINRLNDKADVLGMEHLVVPGGQTIGEVKRLIAAYAQEQAAKENQIVEAIPAV